MLGSPKLTVPPALRVMVPRPNVPIESVDAAVIPLAPAFSVTPPNCWLLAVKAAPFMASVPPPRASVPVPGRMLLAGAFAAAKFKLRMPALTLVVPE